MRKRYRARCCSSGFKTFSPEVISFSSSYVFRSIPPTFFFFFFLRELKLSLSYSKGKCRNAYPRGWKCSSAAAGAIRPGACLSVLLGSCRVLARAGTESRTGRRMVQQICEPYGNCYQQASGWNIKHLGIALCQIVTFPFHRYMWF